MDTIHGDHGNDILNMCRRLEGQTDKLENRKVIIGPARHVAHARLVNVTACKFYLTTDNTAKWLAYEISRPILVLLVYVIAWLGVNLG